MWWILAVGGVIGLLVTQFTPYRHGVWVALGIVAGWAIGRRFSQRGQQRGD